MVVLSNNGCIIARSREAKALGIKMGDPYCAGLLEEQDCAVFSPNFELCSDLSARVQSIMALKCEKVEPYSIDEAFLRLERSLKANCTSSCPPSEPASCKWTGVPVSIGTGRSRTLAKLATFLVKKRCRGLYFFIRAPHESDECLVQIPPDFPPNFRGRGLRCGRRLGAKRPTCGIRTALDLARRSQVDRQDVFRRALPHGAGTARHSLHRARRPALPCRGLPPRTHAFPLVRKQAYRRR